MSAPVVGRVEVAWIHLQVTMWYGTCFWVVVSNIFIFTPTWGNDPVWLILFKWVETTNGPTRFGIHRSCLIFALCALGKSKVLLSSYFSSEWSNLLVIFVWLHVFGFQIPSHPQHRKGINAALETSVESLVADTTKSAGKWVSSVGTWVIYLLVIRVVNWWVSKVSLVPNVSGGECWLKEFSFIGPSIYSSCLVFFELVFGRFWGSKSSRTLWAGYELSQHDDDDDYYY